MTGDPLLQLGELLRVAVEEVELVGGGADRALDAAQRVPVDQVVEPLVRDQQFLGGRGEPLAQRGGLRGDVVRPAGQHQVGVLDGERGQPGQRGDHPVPDQLQRGPDLELLDVLGEVAGGHPLVDVLVPGERAELLDPGLHVVPGDPLPLGDRRQVDLVDHPLVRLDDAVRHATPRSRWARRTASQSRRSIRTFSSGDQRATSSAEAYRGASTFGMVTAAILPRVAWAAAAGRAAGADVPAAQHPDHGIPSSAARSRAGAPGGRVLHPPTRLG